MNPVRKSVMTASALVFLAIAAFVVASRGGSDAAVATTRGGAFAWLRPTAVPASWVTHRLPGSPATLSAPPGWHSAPGDPGTRTMVSRSPSGQIVGYLNATPRQGSETLANWSDFRVDHNRDEGDREVRRLASASGLRFRSATGSCVLDSYATSSGHRYREIACLVSGPTASTVIVAAAPPGSWADEAPRLERAVTDFTT
ncbi:MAG TPA: hypothetical protein VJL81_13360 [Solirubrobacterales bacterium]|nr:hypothetical protein [Solirubrobacterales bacterium]